MGLNKDICKRCYKLNEKRDIWGNNQEKNWNKNGFVHCPLPLINGKSAYCRVTDNPHFNCHFYLEQIVGNMQSEDREISEEEEVWLKISKKVEK